MLGADTSVFLGGSIIAAFVAGLVALFAPCCISVMLPAYPGRLAAEFPIDVVRMDLGSLEGARLAAGAGVPFPPGLLLDGDLLGYGRPSERRLGRKIAQHFADGARLHAREQRHAEVQEP